MNPANNSPKTPDVSTPRVEATLMQLRAAMPNTLMGGTYAMRKAGETYLPKMPMEEARDYADRLSASTLLPFFAETVDDFATKPFTEKIAFSEDTPEEVQAWLENADMTGQDLTAFARGVLKQTLVDGLGFILVDHTKVPAGATLAQERSLGARPYLVHIRLSSLLGWKSAIVDGKYVLTQIRFKETVTEDAGEFGVTSVDQIRVLDAGAAGAPGRFRVYRVNDKSEWVEVPDLSGVTSIQEIPLVAVYTGREGSMAALPPLEGLAYLNVAHWQSASDQRNILHTARVPFLFGKGLDMPKAGEERPVGPNYGIFATDSGADVKWVEHSGKAIEAGRQDLQDLEEQMRQISGELVSSVQKTAKESGIESEQACSWLKAQVIGLEKSLNEALRLMAAWRKLPAGGTVTLFKDFEQMQVDAPMLTAMTGMVQAGNLSKRTNLQILLDAGKLPPDLDIDEELQRIEDESAALMATMPKPVTTVNNAAPGL